MSWVIIGPLEGRLTGQARVTLKTFDIISNRENISRGINTNFEGLPPVVRIVRTLRSLLQFMISIRSSKGYYISIKRGALSIIAGYIYVIIAKLFSKKLILHLHGNEIFAASAKKRYIYRYLILSKLRMADIVCCLNNYQSSELARLHVTNTRIIPNFTDLQICKSVNKTLSKHKKNISIVYLSNFQEQKGFYKFLNLFPKFQNLDFSLCGDFLSKDSPEKKYFDEDHIKSLLNVNFHGFTDGQMKVDILKNSHFIFFVSTYPTEAQPLSLIEAMSQGCVPIVADRPYISNLVTNKNGVVLSPDPTDAEIFQAVSDLSIEKYMELSKNCTTIAQNFTLEAYSKNVMSIFDALS